MTHRSFTITFGGCSPRERPQSLPTCNTGITPTHTQGSGFDAFHAFAHRTPRSDGAVALSGSFSKLGAGVVFLKSPSGGSPISLVVSAFGAGRSVTQVAIGAATLIVAERCSTDYVIWYHRQRFIGRRWLRDNRAPACTARRARDAQRSRISPICPGVYAQRPNCDLHRCGEMSLAAIMCTIPRTTTPSGKCGNNHRVTN
jgi:hypothetical protein